VSRFINENTRDRTNQSVFTTQFLKDQLELARRDLEAVEDKLARFRVANAGKLPDQVTQNFQQLSMLEQRLANLNASVSRINQEKLLTESNIRIYRDQLNSIGTGAEQVAVAQAQAKNERLAQLERDVLNLETQIAAMRENYTETHPDVQRANAALNVLKRKRDSLQKEEAEKKPEEPKTRTIVNPVIAKEAKELEATVKKLQGILEAKDLELEEANKELIRVSATIKNTQARIDATPLGEKEYLDLLRERDLVRARVEELNRKKSMSAIATDLENRQQGEMLELLDPASLPQKPTEPNRGLIVGIGAAAGFLLGLFFAGAREIKDTSLKNLKDVRAYTQLNVLGSIPLLENDLVVRRRRRLAWLAWSTACIIGLLIMSGSMYYYYFIAKA
jgi:uncharacterized protein involved in exopolysaccharide biosynthesis